MKRSAMGAIAIVAASTSALLAQGLPLPQSPPPASSVTEDRGTPSQNTVIVSGTASVAGKPDRVSVTLGVSTRGQVVRQALDDNNAKVTTIISKLKAAGVRPEQIKTVALNVRPVERDNVSAGYEVYNTIEVSMGDVSQSVAMIDQAVDSGANNIYGPEFSVGNEKLVQDACLTSAFADARSTAVTLSKLAGRSLGRVLAVTDGSTSPFEFRDYAGAMGGVAGGVSIEPGMHKVGCGVTVAFELL